MAAAVEEAFAPWNFHWIVKGELAIMGCPRSEGNVRYVLEAGIAHLVSLCPEKQPGFEFFPNHFRWTPIDVLKSEPPTIEQIVEFIKICNTSILLREPLGVHCRMGHGRSGVMAACYLVYFYEMPPHRAVTKIRMISPGAIENYSQEKAVYNYFKYLCKEHPPSTVSQSEDGRPPKEEIYPKKTVLQKYTEQLQSWKPPVPVWPGAQRSTLSNLWLYRQEEVDRSDRWLK